MKTLLMAAAAALLTAGTVHGQTFPSKPIRIIPGEPGGGGWAQMQFMQDLLAKRLGQPVILDARPATLMGGTLARAVPDGYTLLAPGGTVLFGPLLEKTDYDTLSFAAISSLGVAPYFLIVNPSLPVNSVKELIALAKSQPGKLNYSSAAVGSGYYIAGETFKALAGVNIIAVPYKGASPTVQAVVSGEVQLSFVPVENAIQLIRAGKLKGLGHTLRKPTPLAPDLPSVAEAGGLPGFEYQAFNALFAPARTPESIIARLNRDTVWVLEQKEVKDKYLSIGVEAVPSTPDELAATIRAKYAAVAELIKTHGIGQK